MVFEEGGDLVLTLGDNPSNLYCPRLSPFGGPSDVGDVAYPLGGVFRCFWVPASMNSLKLVIPLHSLYWSIHTRDESKRGTAFAFIFGVN